MIRKYGSIEGTLKNLDKAKYPLPEPFPYEAVRELFKHPDVHLSSSLSVCVCVCVCGRVCVVVCRV
jgi:flap endonuclease-1